MGLVSDAALVLYSRPVHHLAALSGLGFFVQRFDIGKLLAVISALGSALTAFKLYHAGLHRRYRIFFAYLVFRVPYIFCAFFRDTQPGFYAWFFVLSEPLVMIFYVLIVLELYRLVLERYRGLYTLGRWAMGVAMALALGVSLASLRMATDHGQKFSWIISELKVEARLDLAIVLFILLIIWFLSRYPIRLNRNVVVHTIVYSVFFFANSVGLVLWLFQIKIQDAVLNARINTGLMGIASACAIAWWLGLTQKGEEVQVHLPSLGPGAERRVLQQLEALNATLLKASRK
jgi:hypothetical protein